MENLLGKTLQELEGIIQEYRLPLFIARQIADWLYKKNISSIDAMSNLSIKSREKIKQHFKIIRNEPVKVQNSADGTKKYLYHTHDGKLIETVYIPEKDRATLCVSSQVGCKMGCIFCMTGRQGFQANLTADEIINQISSLPEREQLTNIVYMGMGEPFDNIGEVMKSLEILTSGWGFAMSPARITVSTIGIIPGMKRFLKETRCHLAVSLHTPFDDERHKLIPVNNINPLKEVLTEIAGFDFDHQRRISFEYIMFEKFNDTSRHIKELLRVLNSIRCRINLIKFHPIPGSLLKGSDDETIDIFKKALNTKGIHTTIRQSRGQDICAACGQLSTKGLSVN
jgi:23S rRNA (adenine2503-C2)-methyltransferase